MNEIDPRSAAPGQQPAGVASYQQSPLLARAGFRHAFFTRLGGASEGPFESLSFSTAVGDTPAAVDENLRRAATLLGVDAARVLFLSQVHGRRAFFYDAPALRTETITLEGDALGGSDASSAYGVRSADCVPVLIADQESGAVMAIHAGWRGVACRVVEAGVSCLRTHLQSPGRLLAAIGPHISAAAFEVSDDVAAELLASCPVPGALAHGEGSSPKPHIDLRFIVTQQLLALGLTEAEVDQVNGCTVLEPERYFSFRRDGKRSGRHLSAIVPRPQKP
ncbi:MAG TPA: polyphenol oxidase family protein [Polyangiaceae bacterium]|nr:polyphenol oxidase family protein [Polyangiaceae bacterium]